MTIPDQLTPQQPEEPTPDEESPQMEEPLLYHISFERLEQLKRSAVVLVAARRVPSCPSWQRPENELTNPQKLVDEIAQHYDDEEGFILTDMPVQEILFRILLARRNKPTLLSDLHYELTERWATPIRPITITEEGLRRVLEADIYYGFARAP